MFIRLVGESKDWAQSVEVTWGAEHENETQVCLWK